MNYGWETNLQVKKPQTSLNQQRNTYLKFVLNTTDKVGSAKLRIYGYNHENTKRIYLHATGLDDDSWQENSITHETAPLAANPKLSSVGVTETKQYYELDDGFLIMYRAKSVRKAAPVYFNLSITQKNKEPQQT